MRSHSLRTLHGNVTKYRMSRHSLRSTTGNEFHRWPGFQSKHKRRSQHVSAHQPRRLGPLYVPLALNDYSVLFWDLIRAENGRRRTMTLFSSFHPSDRMKKLCLSSAFPAPPSAAYRSSPSHCMCGAKLAKGQRTQGRVPTCFGSGFYAIRMASKNSSSLTTQSPAYR